MVALEWEQVAEAYSYQLQISEDPAFRKVVIDSWMIRNKGEVRLKKEGTYHWRVRTASESGEVGHWSGTRKLEVRP